MVWILLSIKGVNLVKNYFTVTEIMNFSKGIVFIGTPCILYRLLCNTMCLKKKRKWRWTLYLQCTLTDYVLADMLLKKYAIECRLLSHLSWLMSALPWETWTQKLGLFSHAVCVSKNDTALACYIFDTHQPISVIFL